MATLEPTLRLIIAYKLARGTAALLAGLALLGLLAAELDEALRTLAVRLGERAANSATEAISALVLWALEPNHVLGVGAFLTLDGVITVIEGWALFRGWWWGVWLVVIASSLLIPVEIAALVEQVTVVRVLILMVNLLIVGWLLRQRWISFATASGTSLPAAE